MKSFHGHIIIQTMFMRGTLNVPRNATLSKRECSKFKVQSSKFNVDNTGEEFVGPWLEVVKQIKPQQVMVYTIDRETPAQGLEKATHEQLDAIRDRVIAAGIPCTASY